MNVGDLTLDHFAHCLANEGAVIKSGPFVWRVTSSLSELAAPLYLLYSGFPLAPPGILDFHLHLRPARGLRRWVRPQCEFLVDGWAPFPPFLRGMALPLVEWGLNWCVYTYALQYLILHAAAVERHGRVLVLPGHSGAGKSTLCGALTSRGWRLFSDELALIRPRDGKFVPIARPMAAKNESIDELRRFAPDLVFGPTLLSERKGYIAHLRPPNESVRRSGEPATPAWIVFPEYKAGAPSRLAPLAKPRAFFRAADNSANYRKLGAVGFETLAQVIDTCRCYEFTYSSLDEATAISALRDCANSTLEPSGLAHLPKEVAAVSSVSYVAQAKTSVTAVRLDGPAASVLERASKLRADHDGRTATEELHGHNSAAFWTEVRDVLPFTRGAFAGTQVWRLSVPPSTGPEVAA